MEKLLTRQRILKEALSLFATKGYESVSVAEIAEAVGIKAPSLYKHYRSKQAIFDAIMKEMAERYEKQMLSMQMNGIEPDKDVGFFININEDQLINMGKNLFLYFLHDEYACNFRRMLTIGQYHNSILGALYAKQYVVDPLSYQGMIFGMFVQQGFMLSENPEIMALHFYAPIFLLLTMCDCNPEREPEALIMIEQHIMQFNKLYLKENI